VLAPEWNEATIESVTSLYGPLVEYDVYIMGLLAWTQRTDVATARRLYDRIAALVPDEYLRLGDYLVDAGLEDEAAAAYEKGIAKAGDRVGVSNNVQWLVGYYCDRSRIDRAREVAQMAADVGSGAGLRAMGYVFERVGRYGDAHDWYQKIVERYGEAHRERLDDFYIRYAHRVGDGRFGGEAAAALAKVFPAGLQRVSLAELDGPPRLRDAVHAVKVSGDSLRDTRLGLLKDDVVVAFNGYRVQNARQYRVLWSFDDRPEATVIVWRQGRYVEVKGRFKHLAYGPISRRL
jgi:tetratricopeptide (TPR) repeat protein